MMGKVGLCLSRTGVDHVLLWYNIFKYYWFSGYCILLRWTVYFRTSSQKWEFNEKLGMFDLLNDESDQTVFVDHKSHTSMSHDGPSVACLFQQNG